MAGVFCIAAISTKSGLLVAFFSMKEAVLLQREIDALRETIQRDWEQVAESGTPEQRDNLRRHLRVCIDDLSGLLVRMEREPGAKMRQT